MKRFFKNQKGFTLIELLIVIAILGILAAVVIPNVRGFMISGHVAAGNAEVASLDTALEAYQAENNGAAPISTGNLIPFLVGSTLKYAYTIGATVGTTPQTIIVGTDGTGSAADSDGLKWVAGTADGTGEVIKAGAWARK